MSGQLVCLEGGDGGGKTTLKTNLTEALRAIGYEIVETREPGGSPGAEEIRRLIVERDQNNALDIRSEFLLFYAARFDHLSRVIVPALERGAVVICDRFELSTWTYQVFAQEPRLQGYFDFFHVQIAEALAEHVCQYVICDIDPVVAAERMRERGIKGANFFDQRNLEFKQRIREGFRKGSDVLNPHFVCHIIDASKSPEEMLADARAALGL